MKWHKIFEQRLVMIIFFTLYYGNDITDIDKILYTTNTSIDVE